MDSSLICSGVIHVRTKMLEEYNLNIIKQENAPFILDQIQLSESLKRTTWCPLLELIRLKLKVTKCITGAKKTPFQKLLRSFQLQIIVHIKTKEP